MKIVKDYVTHFLRDDTEIREEAGIKPPEGYSLFRREPYGRVVIYAMSKDDAIDKADKRVRQECSSEAGRQAGLLEFTVNEQNFLAKLMEEIATLAYKARSEAYLGDELLAKVGDAIAWAAVQFPSVNIGELYDKFHRQGKNQ